VHIISINIAECGANPNKTSALTFTLVQQLYFFTILPSGSN